ncbi:MAG: VWA domain-containing protein [Verrucomicrobiales bacterium]
MTFESPQWIVLLPVLAFAGWYWKQLRLWMPLRVLTLLLVVVVLMNPRWRSRQEGMDLWVLLDQSASAGTLLAKNVGEWTKLLEQSRRGADDQLHIVDYAADVMRRGGQETLVYSGGRELTRTGLAIENSLVQIDSDRPSRIVVFTDGFSTEPFPPGLGEKLLEAGVAVDYRLLQAADDEDLRVTALLAPTRAQVSEPFALEIRIEGTADGIVPVQVLRNGQQIGEASVEVVDGSGSLRFSDRIGSTGAWKYEAVITPERDAHMGNNRRSAWVEVQGGPRVLIVTKYIDDPIVRALQKQGFEVEVVMQPEELNAGKLAGCRAVILNNVPAYEIPREFLTGIDFFVRHQGGGFLMVGGAHSFGAGGYFESPVDSILPVSMDLKVEHLKLVVAMAIVMDRSGSMAMTVAGGRSKMDLADEGAARAVELMGAQDAVCVFAVDSEAHAIVPLQKVGPNRGEIISKVRKIESTGGGIYVYNGLEAGWKELKRSTIGQRHVILFSDAADSEQPHQYKDLIRDIVADGGTVSVIALGTRADPDAKLLEDIAKRGNGRIFFSTDASDLPSLFSMETVAVARSAFVKETTAGLPTGQWYEISENAFEWLTDVDGYNLSYVREWASQALVTTDTYKAPLVAYGQRGIGRVAAVSFPLGGEYSERARAWPKMGDFVQTLGRWLMGEDLPPGVGLRWQIEGTAIDIDLLHDDTWDERLARSAPKILIAQGMPPGQVEEFTWQRMAPGHYRIMQDFPDGQMLRGAIQIGNAAIPFGPLVAGGSAEWAFDEQRIDDLRELSAQTGGRELLELSDAWRSPPQERIVDFRTTLLTALLIVILVDALVTRMGWTLPAFDRMRIRTQPRQSRSRTAKQSKQATAKGQGEPAPTPAAPSSPVAPSQGAETRQSRFDRAKRGKR